MYEFHGWIRISETTEDTDAGDLPARMAELRAQVAAIDWRDGSVELSIFNGEPFLRMTGFVNRIRDEAREAEALYRLVADRLPGSYGLLYERAEDLPEPPGQNAFRVRVLARGRFEERLDPFLSPCNPVIED